MRALADERAIRRLMHELSLRVERPTRLYFTGGATAVLLGWRSTTVDVDVRFLPDRDEVFRALPLLKEKLNINLELAWPPDFIPPLPGWEGRCLAIEQPGPVSFFHYDLYGQALAKIERGHATDRRDVAEMLRGGWVDSRTLLELFEQIEPDLYRYPSIDPPSFRRAVEEWTAPQP